MLAEARYLAKDALGIGRVVADTRTHLREGVSWLCRAQDATPDGGVSHSYRIGKRWNASYPETTGYIIPTLLNWSALAGDAEAGARAVRMADWELEIQMESGAIPSIGGAPVVFDTGQVLFGLLAAHGHTGDGAYLGAAVRAGDWLQAVLDDDGVWRTHGNPAAQGVHTYNARVAWAMLALAEASGRSDYRAAMVRFLAWALAQEEGRSGWFRLNCLNDNARPLLHTIAYTAQGLLESGLLLRDEALVDAARRTADALAERTSGEGRLPGRLGPGWESAARWSCLTGMAQMSIVWQRLDAVGGESRYREVVGRVHRFLKGTQAIRDGNPGVRGGIKGSFPVNGEYGRYSVLNWATKFFLDALLLEEFAGRQLLPS